ncbi:MAG: amidase [Gammaproteobacteria bacterium]|nr:amidase [Gammaproteobacteria bacterium]
MSARTIELESLTLSGAGELLRTRALSAVELAEASIERMHRLQPRLGCFTTMTPELALRQARRADNEIARGRWRGPLHGVPYTLKDVIATSGIVTTFGDPRGVDYRPAEDATVYRLLDAAGGVLLGKVVSEIGRDSQGPVGCRNPWNTELSPGTSSSGSGAAVAAAIGFASIGTDTGGSVRHPASNCGLVGMKATFGRISRHGVWASSWSTDQAGPLTRTVEDNAAMMQILGQFDPRDPVSLVDPPEDYRAGLEDGVAGLRIGVPADDWVWRDWLSVEEETIVRAAIEALESLGAALVDVRLPLAARSREVLFALHAEAPVYMDDHFSAAQLDAWPEHHTLLSQGRAQPFADYLHAQQQRARIRQECDLVLNEVDLIALPTGSTVGDRWDASSVVIRGVERPARSRAVYRNGLASLSGHPALSLPCGFAAGDSLPVGLMLQGRPLSEALLYRVARAYERATDWHQRRPSLVEPA